MAITMEAATTALGNIYNNALDDDNHIIPAQRGYARGQLDTIQQFLRENTINGNPPRYNATAQQFLDNNREQVEAVREGVQADNGPGGLGEMRQGQNGQQQMPPILLILIALLTGNTQMLQQAMGQNGMGNNGGNPTPTPAATPRPTPGATPTPTPTPTPTVTPLATPTNPDEAAYQREVEALARDLNLQPNTAAYNQFVNAQMTAARNDDDDPDKTWNQTRTELTAQRTALGVAKDAAMAGPNGVTAADWNAAAAAEANTAAGREAYDPADRAEALQRIQTRAQLNALARETGLSETTVPKASEFVRSEMEKAENDTRSWNEIRDDVQARRQEIKNIRREAGLENSEGPPAVNHDAEWNRVMQLHGNQLRNASAAELWSAKDGLECGYNPGGSLSGFVDAAKDARDHGIGGASLRADHAVVGGQRPQIATIDGNEYKVVRDGNGFRLQTAGGQELSEAQRNALNEAIDRGAQMIVHDAGTTVGAANNHQMTFNMAHVGSHGEINAQQVPGGANQTLGTGR
jgi:hypothetical protein